MTSLENHLEFAKKVSFLSKDPSTQVGAVFFDKSNAIPLVWGYNGMPRGMDDKDPEKLERPEKYFWFEHAERNAIYNAAQPLMTLNNAICLSSQAPSMEGARALVSAGIKKVFYRPSVVDVRVDELFSLCGIEHASIEKSKTDRLSRKYGEILDLAHFFGQTDSSVEALCRAGSIIINEQTLSPIAAGATRSPPGLKFDTAALRELSPERPWWVQEPEKDAIFSAVKPKLEHSNVFVSWCPCIRCSLALASVGVASIVTKEIDFSQENDRRWRVEFEKTQAFLGVLGIDLVTLPSSGTGHILKTKSKP